MAEYAVFIEWGECKHCGGVGSISEYLIDACDCEGDIDCDKCIAGDIEVNACDCSFCNGERHSWIARVEAPNQEIAWDKVICDIIDYTNFYVAFLKKELTTSWPDRPNQWFQIFSDDVYLIECTMVRVDPVVEEIF